jgi:hypothetical protein
VYAGGSASRTYKYSYAGLPTETTFGIQTRYDAISLGLTDIAAAWQGGNVYALAGAWIAHAAGGGVP